MAHTSVASGPVSGVGDWAAASGGDWLYVRVTAAGASRIMSSGPPVRLFEVGWFSIGNFIADPPGDLFYETPRFIEMQENLFSTFLHTQPTANPTGVDSIHYELNTGVTVEFTLYTFF